MDSSVFQRDTYFAISRLVLMMLRANGFDRKALHALRLASAGFYYVDEEKNVHGC